MPETAVACHVLDTGYCLASEHHLIRGGRRVTIHCHSIVALLCHPTHGWLLWDTGYAPRMLDETRRLPYAVYRLTIPIRLDPQLAVVRQLNRFGLGACDVCTIILSHFHADHVAGLRDFPGARLVATRAGYDAVAGRTGWGAVRRAFLPGLMPEDFERRAQLLGPFAGAPLGCLGPTHDLFGDGAVRLVELPGHAHGQIGMLAQTKSGPLFFVADGCWLSRNYRENTPPHWMTHLMIDDVKAMKATIANLHRWAVENPSVPLIPTHCPETFQRFVGSKP